MRAWERFRLRRAAMHYASHGWHVRPGAFPFRRRHREPRFDCGEPRAHLGDIAHVANALVYMSALSPYLAERRQALLGVKA